MKQRALIIIALLGMILAFLWKTPGVFQRNQNAVTPPPKLNEKSEKLSEPYDEIRDDVQRFSQLRSAMREQQEAHLINLLDKDAEATIRALSDPNLEIDPEITASVLFVYFQKSGNWPAMMSLVEKTCQREDVAMKLLPLCIMAMAEKNPQEARTWLFDRPTLLGAGTAANQLGKQAFGAKVEYEPHWLEGDRLAKNEAAQLYTVGYAEGMAFWDVKNAITFLEKLPRGTAYDRSAYEVLQQSGELDPSTTMQWAQTIVDPGLKRSAMLEAAMKWKRISSEAYEAWLKNAQVEADLRPDLEGL